MFEELKERVYKANMLLPKYSLVTFTWGNASEIDRAAGVIAIKPSGVDYDELSPDKMVLLDLEGNVIEGSYKPSSDTPTHIELYKAFKNIGGVVHTHSTYATAFSQAKREIVAYGTTHADYFYGNIPCTPPLTKEEIEIEYEKNTGKVIARAFENIDENAIPGVLVASHGPFTWGKNASEAVYFSKVLEETAKMAFISESLSPNIKKVDSYLLDKHYFRKHGKNAYYGQ